MEGMENTSFNVMRGNFPRVEITLERKKLNFEWIHAIHARGNSMEGGHNQSIPHGG